MRKSPLALALLLLSLLGGESLAQYNTAIEPSTRGHTPGTDFGQPKDTYAVSQSAGYLGDIPDRHWFLTVLPAGASSAGTTGPSHATVELPNPAWYTEPAGSRHAGWIGPPVSLGSGTRGVPGGVYRFATHFSLPETDDLNSEVLHGAFAAAGISARVLVNGVDTGVSGGNSSSLTNFTLDASNSAFARGDNALEIEIAVAEGAPAGIFCRILTHTAENFAAAAYPDARVGRPLHYPSPAGHSAFAYTARGLPPGLSLNVNTGELTGTPTAPGTYAIKIEASDRTGGSVFRESATVTLVVTDSEWKASADGGGVVIAYGAGKVVTVTAAGTAQVKAGGKWTAMTGAFPNGPPAAMAYGGGYFVAVGAAGEIDYSTDGLHWSRANSGTTESLVGVTIGEAGSPYVAVGAEGTILSSQNPLSWDVAVPSPGDGTRFNAVAGGGDLYFVAEGLDGTGAPFCAISTDATTWAHVAIPAELEGATALATDGRRFVLAGVGTSVSGDGRNWSPLAALPEGAQVTALAYGAGTFLAVGSTTSSTRNASDTGAYFSQDGLTWSRSPFPPGAWGPVQVALGGAEAIVLGTDDLAHEVTLTRPGKFPKAAAPPLVSFSGAIFQAAEETGKAVLPVVRTGNLAVSAAAVVHCPGGDLTDAQTAIIRYHGVDVFVGSPAFIGAYRAVAGQDYQATDALLFFKPGETVKFVEVPLLRRAGPGGGRSEFTAHLEPLGDMTEPGDSTDATVSILNSDVAVQIVSSTVTRGSTPNTGLTIDFAGNLDLLNSSALDAEGLRVKLVAHAGYFHNSFDTPPALPADLPLGTFPLAGPIAAADIRGVEVSGTIPAPSGTSTDAIFWTVVAVIQQESNGTWYDSSSPWVVIDGISQVQGTEDPTNQGGAVQTSSGVLQGSALPAFTGLTPPVVTSVSIAGPAEVQEFGAGNYSVRVGFSDGTALSALNPAWKSSLAKFPISAAGVLQVGELTAPTETTIAATALVGGVARRAVRTIKLKPLQPNVNLVALAPAARRTPGAESAIVRISRSGPVAHRLEVQLQASGTAVSGTDYAPLPAGVTLPPGAAFLDVPVTAMPAAAATPTLFVTLGLVPAPTYRAGKTGAADVTIVGTNSLQFDVPAIQAVVGAATVHFTVQRDPAEDVTQPLTVDYTAVQIIPSSQSSAGVGEGTLTFGSGVQTAGVDIAVSRDLFSDGDVQVIMTLSNPGGAACLGVPFVCTATIPGALADRTSAQGAYWGYDASLAPALLQATLGRGGAVTGRIRSTVNLSFAGKFDQYGFFRQLFRGNRLTYHLVELQITDAAAGTIVGRVTEGNASGSVPIASLQAVRNGYDASHPFPQAGSYTVLLPHDPGRTDPLAPQGDGFARLTASASGTISMVGTLGDGTPFSCASGISPLNAFPIYASSPTRGAVSGSAIFRNVPHVSDFDASLLWQAPPRPGLFAQGIDVMLQTAGGYYAPPVQPSTILPLVPDGQGHAVGTFHFLEGADVAAQVSLSISDAALLTSGGPLLSLAFTRKTGLFSGKYRAAARGVAVPFRGAVLLKQGTAKGVAISPTAVGYVELGP